MSRRRKAPAVITLTLAERALFRAAVADVVPLVSDKRYFEPDPVPAIVRSHECVHGCVNVTLTASLSPRSFDIHSEGDDAPTYLGTGLPRSLLKDLRRGRWAVEAEIDLHGLNRDAAHEAFMGFLGAALARGCRCLRIVHGKGLRSPGGEAVLRALVRRWLAGYSEVLAYCPASAADGGAGAVLVLLRVRR